MNGTDGFLDIHDSHLRVLDGNIHAKSIILDQLDITSSNTTTSTVQFLNTNKAFKTTANIEVGNANLFVDTSTSNVGILTSTPTYTLDVRGTANVEVLRTTSNIEMNGGTFSLGGHIIPTTHEQYDIGTAEKKIRHLFLSDNSLWIGDKAKISYDNTGDKLTFHKRKASDTFIPAKIIELANASGQGLDTTIAIQNHILEKSYTPGNLGAMKLHHWLQYAKDFQSNIDLSDIFTSTESDYDSMSTAEGLENVPGASNGELYTTRKVRIGSSEEPTANLDIEGTLKVSGNATVSSNVGIGTASPNVLLELSSDTGSATIVPTELRLSTTTIAGDWDTTNPWGKITFYSADTSNSGPKVRGAIGMSPLEIFGGYGRLGFFTEYQGTLGERMSIKHDGNVGVGTISPLVTLDTHGTVRSSAPYPRFDFYTTTNRSTNEWGNSTDNAGDYRIYSNGDASDGTKRSLNFDYGQNSTHTTRMAINANGNVGVATTSPVATLHINGSLYNTAKIELLKRLVEITGGNNQLHPIQPGMQLYAHDARSAWQKYQFASDSEWLIGTLGSDMVNGGDTSNFDMTISVKADVTAFLIRRLSGWSTVSLTGWSSIGTVASVMNPETEDFQIWARTFAQGTHSVNTYSAMYAFTI